MEEIKTISIVQKREEHQWTCDNCKKVIGTSVAYEDGYVPTPNGVNYFSGSFKLNDVVFKYNDEKRCYCNKCFHELEEKLLTKLNELNELGFYRKDN